ncbi:MAG TPA: DUF4389 domain-containing protein [Acidimicrobiales bacterium]
MPEPYPAQLVFAPPDRIANWRPLVQWLLAIPHFMVLYALRSVVEILAIISWFIIVFTGGLPDGIARVQAMFLRYQARVSLYAGFLQAEYPPFTFDTVAADPGDVSRLRVDLQPELQNRNRVTVGFRLILAIPQAIVLVALWIAAVVVLIIGFFAVLFTGHWPEGLRTFVLNVVRYQLRFEAYLFLLTDRYPPFALN